jgi:hypothetical protein
VKPNRRCVRNDGTLPSSTNVSTERLPVAVIQSPRYALNRSHTPLFRYAGSTYAS